MRTPSSRIALLSIRQPSGARMWHLRGELSHPPAHRTSRFVTREHRPGPRHARAGESRAAWLGRDQRSLARTPATCGLRMGFSPGQERSSPRHDQNSHHKPWLITRAPAHAIPLSGTAPFPTLDKSRPRYPLRKRREDEYHKDYFDYFLSRTKIE